MTSVRPRFYTTRDMCSPTIVAYRLRFVNMFFYKTYFIKSIAFMHLMVYNGSRELHCEKVHHEKRPDCEKGRFYFKR